MLNIEYYKDRLVKLGIINPNKLALVQGQPQMCGVNIKCYECLFSRSNLNCSHTALNWLFTEYKEEKEEPKVDWSKVKVDTPIYVRDSENENDEWKPRYFAKYVKGEGICAWDCGTTSFSSGNESNYNTWKYAKLAESEETVWQRSELQKN